MYLCIGSQSWLSLQRAFTPLARSIASTPSEAAVKKITPVTLRPNQGARRHRTRAMKKIFLFLIVFLLSSLKAITAEPYALLSDNNTKLTFYYGTKPADAIEALYIYFGSSSGSNARATQPTTGSSRDPE